MTLNGLKENVCVSRFIPAGIGAFVNNLKRVAARRDYEALAVNQSHLDALEASEEDAA